MGNVVRGTTYTLVGSWSSIVALVMLQLQAEGTTRATTRVSTTATMDSAPTALRRTGGAMCRTRVGVVARIGLGGAWCRGTGRGGRKGDSNVLQMF